MSKKIELDQIIRNEFYEYIYKNINSNCMPLHGNIFLWVCLLYEIAEQWDYGGYILWAVAYSYGNIDSISECKEILKAWKLNVLMSK